MQLMRALVDDDAIRQDHRIAMGAMGQTDARVQAEEASAGANARLAQLVNRRTPADLDVDVVKSVLKRGRKLIQRLLDHTLELASFHVAHILSRCGEN